MQQMQAQREDDSGRWIELAIIFGLALAIRLIGLRSGLFTYGGGVSPDEMFHLLAARSWLTDGTLAMADGVYERAAAFTIALGWLFSVFGESETVARGFTAVVGSIWVVAVFGWTRWVAGRTPAWIAAGLFGLAPGALWLSQFIRFYTLHGLTFWLGATGWYLLWSRRWSLPSTFAILAVTIALLGFSLHLQAVTLIGAAALGVWSVLLTCYNYVAAGPLTRVWVVVSLGVAAAAVAALAVISEIPIIDHYIDKFLYVAPWNKMHALNYTYYHDLFLDQYPTLWSLLPIAALIAIATRPRVGVFCSVMWAVPLLVHSVAPMKQERYIYYAVPFFFILWGMALSAAVPAIRAVVARAVDHMTDLRPEPWLKRLLTIAILGSTVTFVAISNPALPRVARTILGPSVPAGHPRGDWPTAVSSLRPLSERAEVVLSTDGIHSIYYLGRLDYWVREIIDRNEFDIYGPTRRPVVGAGHSLGILLDCHRSALFVGESWRWRRSVVGVPDDAADVIEGRMRTVPLPPESNLIAFYWNNPNGPDRHACAQIDASRPARSTLR